jgi:hypothetical protein
MKIIRRSEEACDEEAVLVAIAVAVVARWPEQEVQGGEGNRAAAATNARAARREDQTAACVCRVGGHTHGMRSGSASADTRMAVTRRAHARDAELLGERDDREVERHADVDAVEHDVRAPRERADRRPLFFGCCWFRPAPRAPRESIARRRAAAGRASRVTLRGAARASVRRGGDVARTVEAFHMG